MNREQVYETLKERIVYLDYRPDRQLRERKIREEFGIGRTPLREIFIQLEAEGLIQTVPNSGTYVTTVGFRSMRNVFEVRRNLIKLVGQLATERIEQYEIDRLCDIAAKIKEETEPKELMKLDSKFHDVLNKSTKNEILYKTLQRLRQQAVRIWGFPREKNFLKFIPQEFKQLIQALRDKDKKASQEILVKHTKRLIDEVKNQFY